MIGAAGEEGIQHPGNSELDVIKAKDEIGGQEGQGETVLSWDQLFQAGKDIAMKNDLFVYPAHEPTHHEDEGIVGRRMPDTAEIFQVSLFQWDKSVQQGEEDVIQADEQQDGHGDAEPSCLRFPSFPPKPEIGKILAIPF